MPVPATPKTDAELIEVFSSIQGEGVLLGWRQLFIRFSGCNLDCRYCDTPFVAGETFRIEDGPGSGRFVEIPNPVSLPGLLGLISPWLTTDPGLHHSISLTGGEPLLYPELLSTWLPVLRQFSPIHLETNGTIPDALAPLVNQLDWISMDIKLESVTGIPTPWNEHRRFLKIARSCQCQVKAVIGEGTGLSEIESAATLIQEAAPEVPLILQPETVDNGVSLSGLELLRLHSAAARIHPSVRIIPQTHHLIKIF